MRFLAPLPDKVQPGILLYSALSIVAILVHVANFQGHQEVDVLSFENCIVKATWSIYLFSHLPVATYDKIKGKDTFRNYVLCYCHSSILSSLLAQATAVIDNTDIASVSTN